MDKENIKKLARLARIKIPEKEIKNFMDISNIIKTIAIINKIDTQEITPMAHPINISQRLRTDEVITSEHDQRDNLQDLAPDNVESGIYLVPKVIE